MDVRGEDLRPSITDPAMFGRSHAEDELVDVLELLWSGRPAEALRRLSSFPETLRVRALTADCHRDLGLLGGPGTARLDAAGTAGG